ncbi:ComF family protein [Amycolatopsis sp. NPDC049688]|uniref:ComF family protein n=1 Tax=Amycolatopsis sp. NPDC049688 TaxID=3154733 RepID=UPI003432CF7B
MKRLIDLLIPARCAACGARGEPCCARCEGVWGAAREVVRGPVVGVVRVFALARYRGVGRKLLIAYKERGRRDLAPSLGRVLAEALVELPLGVDGAAVPVRRDGDPAPASQELAARARGIGSEPVSGRRSAAEVRAVPPVSPRAIGPVSSRGLAAQVQAPTVRRALCLVPAPSRRSAARVRGGPHVERLANAAASVLAARGIEATVAPALELTGGARDAVGLNREQRIANLTGRLRFREAGRPPPGIPIVVLDDVVTTGATAAACARALAAEGFTVSAVLTLLAAG